MCRVFVSGRGNVFMREIAEHLVEALALCGRPAELVVDDLPDGSGDPIDNLVVAPHELFVLSAASEGDRLRAAAAAVCINTEQPGTPFFDLAMRYASQGVVVLDINRFSLDAVWRSGVPAVHLPLGCTPSMDAWGGDRRDRAIDFAFLAGSTPRREQFIAGAAAMLWEWRTDLRLFSWHQPILEHDPTFVAGRAKLAGLAGTRILLNVPRGEEPYFEWARVVEALANGCVVASETSMGIEPRVPGVHFLMAPFEHLAEQAVALAFDEPRRTAMAEAAYKLTTTDLAQPELLQAALADAARVARPSARRLGIRSTRRPRWPKPAAATPTSDALPKAVKELKAAFVAQFELTRSIEATLSLIEHGDPDHADAISTAAWASFDAEVSVVIPLYNDSHRLADAVSSVIAASGDRGPLTELLIVDDHSTDDSRQLAARLLGDIEWFPVMLIARAANGGPRVARKVGFDAARAPHVFVLDPTETLYPTGLRRLLDTLKIAPSDVVGAYGMFERFDATGSLGLVGHLPWDPELLVQGLFGEANAMFRREAWQKLCSDSVADAPFGWDGYDLWLSAAERGLRAELVRSIVGRHRHRRDPMRTISRGDIDTTFVKLRERHPRLPWPS